ncbi:MAG: S41 family peptidase [Paludibacteraceae bacterium]|nr:S41 family peptidase [Paludibacteraceae bacterium]
MSRFLVICLTLFSAIPFLSCDRDLEKDNNIEENFESLWRIIDERYCFFELKKDSIIDWKQAHDIYLPKAMKCTTNIQLFDVFADMLNELKDGHVNLTSTFDVTRYDLQGEHKDNFVSNVIFGERYLGKHYRKAGGLLYVVLPGNVGYIRYSSFSNAFSNSNLSAIWYFFQDVDGLIIDIRGNGGGVVTNVDLLAGCFVDEKIKTGYWQRKTGKGHADLSEPEPIYLKPNNNASFLGKPVAVLVNRDVYSAANLFSQTMAEIPHTALIGDKTGGGSGMPASNELPCGWNLRFSSSIHLRNDFQCAEWGIDPDIRVDLDVERAFRKGEDNMIETAVLWVKSESKKIQ